MELDPGIHIVMHSVLSFKTECDRTSIKLQALVNFMAEWRENQVKAPTNQLEHWVLYFYSSLKLGGGGAGVLFISLRGEHLKYVFKYYSRSLTTRPSTKHYCTGYAWQSPWASSDYSSMVTPYWWFNKSTRSGTSIRTPWTPTLWKYASSRKSSRGCKFTMWFTITMWAQMHSPN
jgi:hypothetical protein